MKIKNNLSKFSYIKNIGNGKWRVFSEDGKNMGTFTSKEKAIKRLKQIEYFKHKKANLNVLDLSCINNLTFSSVMREINKKYSTEILDNFINNFKKNFDKLFCENEKNPEEKALIMSLLKLHSEVND